MVEAEYGALGQSITIIADRSAKPRRQASATLQWMRARGCVSDWQFRSAADDTLLEKYGAAHAGYRMRGTGMTSAAHRGHAAIPFPSWSRPETHIMSSLSVEERLVAVEFMLARSRRTTRYLLVLPLVMAGALLAAMVPSPQLDVVRARGFTLVDDSGTERGSLSFGERGTGLALCDAQGVRRTSLFVDGETSKLILYGVGQAGSATMSAGTDKTELILIGAPEAPRAQHFSVVVDKAKETPECSMLGFKGIVWTAP